MSHKERLVDLTASIPEVNRWKCDREIDFENVDIRGRTVPLHLGQIASDMTDWEGAIADNLGLTEADKADIMDRFHRKPSLQRREALSIWKSGLGSQATYKALMEVFVKAGRVSYAKTIVEILKGGLDCAETTMETPQIHAKGSLTGSAQAPQDYEEGGFVTSGGGFSSAMTPDQLAQWLLQEYGKAYKREIDKLTDALINGELFLELPDDKELLEELKLSPAFKRLVVKKAKQLKKGSSASASVPAAASNSEASLPETESRLHIPLCTSADLDEAASDTALETEPEGDVLSAWVPKNVIWRGRTDLQVKFLNDTPSHWTYGGSGMNVGNIMSWANEWSLRGGGTIPTFTWIQDPNAPSDIRVKFTNSGMSKTMIGKKAQKAKYDEATMWLDLHSGGVDDGYKKYTVIHEFGHALGLGHEHQRSDFWKLIKSYVDITKMKKDLGVTSFKINWDSDQQFKRGKCTAYDPHSIMHYWFEKDWLTNGYADKSKVEKDRNSGTLPQDVAEALLGVHGHSGVSLADRPSDMDIQLLKDLYRNTSCTILGPPPQPGVLQEPKRPRVNHVLSNDDSSRQAQALTMRLLSNLKTKSGKINIIQKVAPFWVDLALNLDFDPTGTTIPAIEKKYRYDPEACCREMMQMWLTGRGTQPATWELLVEILRDCNLIVLAQQVEEATQ